MVDAASAAALMALRWMRGWNPAAYATYCAIHDMMDADHEMLTALIAHCAEVLDGTAADH